MFIELTKIYINNNKICQDDIYIDIKAIDAFYKKDLSYFVCYGSDYTVEITKESYNELLNINTKYDE